MKYNTFRIGLTAVALGLFAACTEQNVSPKTDLGSGKAPSYDFQTPFNGGGQCMNNDAVSAPTGTISGVKQGDDPLTASNCTSNDVNIAKATINSYQVTDENGVFQPPVIFHTGDVVSCIAGSAIKLDLSAELDETATSARSDVGIWIATDGGNAQTGACNHYNLTTTLPLGAGVSNPDGDHCGDMQAGAVVPNFPLGQIDAICQTAGPTSTVLHVGSCLAWKEPGGDTVCPLGSSETPQGYRFGTLFANKSKCNCDGFDLPITVKQKATLEVRKACTPTNDPGTFDLLIDASTTVNSTVVGDNKTCGTGTGPQFISAGTSTAPGAAHTFGEGDFTLANYTSTYACVNRAATGPQHVFTAAGDAAATGSSLGPNQITMEPNEDVICTYTNVRKPKLTLKKTVVNDNGGTADASAWTLTATGTGGFSGTGLPATGLNASLGPNFVNIGVQYTLSESGGPSGYSSNNTWVCTGTGGVFATPNKVTLAAGDDVTCAITNDDVGPNLTLAKHVINDNGGTANASAWTLSATGTAASFSGTGLPATGVDASKGPVGVAAGVQYTLGESGGPAGYSTTGVWVCTGGGSFTSPNKITLSLGEAVTCTITNNDIVPALTLDKIVNFTHGGTALESAWTLTADGGAAGTLSGPGAAGHTDVQSPATFKAGTYALSESAAPAGYANGANYSCVKTPAGGSAGAPVSGNSITLGVGDAATCSITNTDIGASLTLVKKVQNDNGGTATVSAFGLSTNAGTPVFGAGSTAGTLTTYTSGALPVNAGSYTLVETGATGYTSGSWSCTGNATAIGSTTFNAGSVTVGLAEAVVCTITNNDIAPALTLDKIVSYTHGGSALESAWTLTATGGAGTLSGPGATGHTDVVSTATFKAGTYALSESAAPAGYSNGASYSCVKTPAGGSAGAAVSGNSITLAVGDAAICSITNTDVAPALTLDKIVNFTHGGTALESAWTLTADGGAAGTLSGPGASGHADVTSPGTFKAGTYALSESAAPAGYTNGANYSCVKTPAGGSAGAAVSGNSITLAVGDAAICSITNTDIAPSLTLDKITSYSFGGTALESAWTLTADAGTPGKITGPGAAGHTDVVSTGTFKAGTYALSESAAPAGYTNGANYSCVKTPAGGSAGAAVSGNSITLAVGDVAICSITNTDNPSTLIIVKTVKGIGGTFSFTGTGAGVSPSFSLSPATDGSAQTSFTNLVAGTTKTVTETLAGGWALTDLSCSDQGAVILDPKVTQTVSTSLAVVGGTVTCTFVNEAQGSQTTRTQGFWATHQSLTNQYWFQLSAGDQTFCGTRQLTTIGQVLGGFWSNIAKTSTGGKRSDLDQSRMQLLQQLLAAILNHQAFNASPSGSISIDQAKAAYCGTDVTAIKNAQSAMASFNTSGDNGTFTPGSSANGKTAKDAANLPFWDVLP